MGSFNSDYRSFRIAMGRFSVLVLMVVVIVTHADEQCDDCNKQTWINGADSDPHVAVRLPNSKLDRPICYDLDGRTTTVLRISANLFSLPMSMRWKSPPRLSSLNASLIIRPRRSHGAVMFLGHILRFSRTRSRISRWSIGSVRSSK